MSTHGIRDALRTLVRSPGSSTVGVLTLALSIGAATIVFSIADSVLFRPLPFKNADEIFLIWQSDDARNFSFVELSYPAVREWRERSRLFDAIAGLSSVNEEVVLAEDGNPIAIEGRWVTGNFFTVFGVNPLLGRTLLPDDDRSGARAVVVLSHALWRDQFGADRAVVGKSIVLDDESHTIVGVMPAGFDYPRNARFWVPIGPTAPRLLDNRNVMWMVAVGRLRPGVAIGAARSELTTLWRQEHETRFDVSGYSAVLTPLPEAIFGRTHPALTGVLGASGLLLIIACINVTGLHVLRTTERSAELAVRQALGASRGRLLSHVFGECLMLVVFGFAGGLLLALVVTPVVVAAVPAEVPRLDEVRVGLRAVTFGLVASGGAAVVSGIASALLVSRISLSRDGSSRTISGRNEFRRVLVVTEVAAAVMLAVGAGLTARSFIKLAAIPLGFDSSILTMRVSPQGDFTKNQAFYRDLLERIRQLPGVESAAAITQRPLWNTVGSDWSFTVEGQSVRDAERNPIVNLMAISSDYFTTMGIPVRRGRPLTDADADGQPGAVVISESLARRVWPGRDPIGQRVKMPLGATPYHNAWMTVVGVVGEARYRELQAARLDLYISYLQADHRLNHLMIRTQEDPAALVPGIRALVREMDRNLPITNATTMAQVVSEVLSTPAFVATLFGVFALVAAGLAGLGVYGLLAYAVARRTREVGVRMALGAVPSQILSAVVREAVILAAIGGAVGITAALTFAHLMSTLVFGVSVRDPITFTVVPLLLVVVSVCASIFPAYRAARVNPLVALRYE